MATYVILTRIGPGAFSDPNGFRKMAVDVSEKIKSWCPGVVWKESYGTLGNYDVVDIVESDDPKQIQRAAIIIRAYGHADTETMPATPWKQFLANLEQT